MSTPQPSQPATATAEAIADAIDGSALLQRLISNEQPPLSAENHRLIRDLDSIYDDINTITKAWCQEFLLPAKPVDPAAEKELDDYAKPLITLAEIIRRKHKSLISLAADVYRWGIERVDKHCQEKNIDLHRGALHANYAITLLEQGRYKAALGWLHAAAEQDRLHRANVTLPSHSYAFSASGIFGQWIDAFLLPKLPADVLGFVNTQLGANVGNSEVKDFWWWLAGRGDLHIISSILDFDEVSGRTDFHADAVRLSSVRDLATLFEVLIKQIGALHNDPAVVAAFASPPTMAALVCHMHFVDRLRQRRATPALNVNRSPGLFHNSLLPSDDILDAVDQGIDYCSGDAHNVDDVWTYLNSTILSLANPMADAAAKRILLAYKLRNTTSHTFNPVDPNMRSHYSDFRLWLLQGVFFVYFWVKTKGYAAV